MQYFRTLIFVCIIFCSTISGFTQIKSINGQLVNGRGTAEKLDHVSIKYYLNGDLISSQYTDEDGNFLFNLSTGVEETSVFQPKFQLKQNYPNPFNPNTTIAYVLNQNGNVRLDIFNILGQNVRTLVNRFEAKGEHLAIWDGKNTSGQLVSGGAYFYRFKFDNKTEIRKMCFLNAPTLATGNFSIHETPGLFKSTLNNSVEIVISDRDIEDTTLVYQFDQLPESLDLNDIQIHVYPFIRTQPDTVTVMIGENVSDTLDIYFERPIEVSSPHIDVHWDFTGDSLIDITYLNVNQDYIYVKAKEIDNTKSGYAAVYFNLSPRLGLDKPRLHRGYVGIPYTETVDIKNAVGDVQLIFSGDLPVPLIYDNFLITGTPEAVSKSRLFFEIEDDRSISIFDSTMLIINDPTNINLNEYTVEKLEEYPTNGTHPYSWVGTYTGVTQDIYYKNVRIAKANPNGSKSCYCCGLTFEVFFFAIQQLLSDLNQGEDVNSMSANDMKNFISVWFVQSTWGDGPGIALRQYGLGDNIADWNDVQTGDFVQLWRTTGSGHSVIFVNWVTNTSGERLGFRYWSTQGSTSGIGYNTEYFSGSGGTVNPARTYFARLYSPENFVPLNRSALAKTTRTFESDEVILPKYFMNNE